MIARKEITAAFDTIKRINNLQKNNGTVDK